MEKLKKTISQYSKWFPLEEYISRIETYRDMDYSQAFENAKSLLETIGKEICKQKDQPLDDNSTLNGVMKNAFRVMGYPTKHHTTQISSSLANIGQNVGVLRNVIGTTAHGKTLEQMQRRNHAIDDLTKHFLLDSVEIVACFMIRLYEGENIQEGSSTEILKYTECEEFNEEWDLLYGEFKMGDYSFTSSEVLFSNDPNAYETEYRAHVEQLKEDIQNK